jgi:poly(hydroxyalkanoate) depolymerase family esterase
MLAVSLAEGCTGAGGIGPNTDDSGNTEDSGPGKDRDANGPGERSDADVALSQDAALSLDASLRDAGSNSYSEVKSFGDNPAQLRLWQQSPASAPKAIVIALPGCTQSASDFRSTGLGELAAKTQTTLLIAEQVSANNPNLCFRWYETGHTRRDQGELKGLASMVRHAQAMFPGVKTYAVGFSAGAAMGAALVAQYPDLFEAAALFAGIPFRCADSVVSAFGCLGGSTTKTEQEWAQLVTSVAPANANYPRLQLWTGSQDPTVAPQNLTELAKQWSKVHNATERSRQTDSGVTQVHYANNSGQTKIETRSVAGMGHAIPRTASECGSNAPYTEVVSQCGAREAFKFFGLTQ